MAESAGFLRRQCLRCIRESVSLYRHSNYCTTVAVASQTQQPKQERWFILPPFTSSSIDPTSVGKEIAWGSSKSKLEAPTALKWVLRCCPQLPRSLVQKLFRLRQVRRESGGLSCTSGEMAAQNGLKRVSAKEEMSFGDRIFLPVSVQQFPSENRSGRCSEEEIEYMQSMVLYKDAAIIVLNKPAGMPVQGGIGIRKSLDALSAAALRHGYPDPPRLVHRLDMDSSGILVMGRTQTSATILHSIFREKTVGASANDAGTSDRILQRRYLALVLGTPRRARGVISAPLVKVVVDDGKSERITISRDRESPSSQHAITEYKVIKSSDQGYSWLELSPVTGRKHQLRVHCAEIMGTPIVGDYKYGRQAHKKWKPFNLIDHEMEQEKLPEQNPTSGMYTTGGSIAEKEPSLHLHSWQITLPDVSQALEEIQSSSRRDFSKLGRLDFVAPLPSHMQRSWDMLNCGPL